MVLKRRKRDLQLSLRYEADLYRKIANGNPNYKKIKILRRFFFYSYIRNNDSLFVRLKKVRLRVARSRIPQLNDEDGSVPVPEELVLSLDDFELLEDSNVRVIKENEVVWYDSRSSQISDFWLTPRVLV